MSSALRSYEEVKIPRSMRKAIQRFPLVRFVPAMDIGEHSTQDEVWEPSALPDVYLETHNATCNICLEEFEPPRRKLSTDESSPSKPLRQLPCTHVFHTLCIDPWLAQERTCALCRQNVFEMPSMQIHYSLSESSSVSVHLARPSSPGARVEPPPYRRRGVLGLGSKLKDIILRRRYHGRDTLDT